MLSHLYGSKCNNPHSEVIQEKMEPQLARVTAKISLNRLYVRLEGQITISVLENVYTDIRFCVADLEPGFDVITDLSNCSVASLSAIPAYRKIINHLILHKVGRVIRILHNDNLLIKQLLNFAAKIQGYKTQYVKSIEEAELLLKNSPKRESPQVYLHKHHAIFHSNSITGEGKVDTLSTTGCSIQLVNNLPTIDDAIVLYFQFDEEEALSAEFELEAIVTWVEKTSFGARFSNLTEQLKEDLWQRLLYESRCELV